MAALVKQVEELKKGQEQIGKDVGKLAGEMKALDAQAAFLVGETKTAATDREQLKAAIQQQDGAVRALRSALDETNQKVATLSVPPPAPVVAPKPAAPTAGREVDGREALRDRDGQLPRRRARPGGARVHRADRQVPQAQPGRERPVLDRRGLLSPARLQPGGDRVPEGARSLPAERAGAGVAAQARHVLPRPARPAARARDVGAGGEVAPADRGRHPGARAARLSRRRPLAAGDRARPVLPQFDAPVY